MITKTISAAEHEENNFLSFNLSDIFLLIHWSFQNKCSSTSRTWLRPNIELIFRKYLQSSSSPYFHPIWSIMHSQLIAQFTSFYMRLSLYLSHSLSFSFLRIQMVIPNFSFLTRRSCIMKNLFFCESMLCGLMNVLLYPISDYLSIPHEDISSASYYALPISLLFHISSSFYLFTDHFFFLRAFPFMLFFLRLPNSITFTL